MKRSILSLTGTLLSSILLIAQNSAVLDINNMHMQFNSSGHISVDPVSQQPGCEVPAGLGVHSLYAAGLWLGGMDPNNQLHIAAQKYGQASGDDYWPGPLTNNGAASITPAISQQYDHVWTVLRSDVDTHAAYYACQADPSCDVSVQFPTYVGIPPYFFDWPAHGDVLQGQDFFLAPFVENPSTADGFYDPTQGDHPCIPGDKAVFFIFNDQRVHGLSGGIPIGVEIHGMAYAFNSGDPALDNTVFLHYQVINQSSQTLTNSYSGIFADFDLGNYDDDYVGSDVERALMYALNGDNDDQAGSVSPGYGLQPPAFGITVLQGPHMDADGTDNPVANSLPAINGVGFGDGTTDNERHGLSITRYFNNSGGTMGDPGNAAEHYDNLRGHWNDGSQQLYGGSGHISDPTANPIQPAAFAYPDASDPTGAATGGNVQAPWSEAGLLNFAGDRRMLGSMGPYTIQPGQHRPVDIAFVYARAASGGPQASVQALQARVDSVQAFFVASGLYQSIGVDDECSPPNAVAVTDVMNQPVGLTVYPVPAFDAITLTILGNQGKLLVNIHDITGKLVQSNVVTAATNRLSVAELEAGVYLLSVATERGSEMVRFVKE